VSRPRAVPPPWRWCRRGTGRVRRTQARGGSERLAVLDCADSLLESCGSGRAASRHLSRPARRRQPACPRLGSYERGVGLLDGAAGELRTRRADRRRGLGGSNRAFRAQKNAHAARASRPIPGGSSKARRVTLDGFVSTLADHVGVAVIGRRVTLLNSTLSGSRIADIPSTRRPVLVNTTCERGEKRYSGPTWGVCTND
jgi:hypothetical protein